MQDETRAAVQSGLHVKGNDGSAKSSGGTGRDASGKTEAVEPAGGENIAFGVGGSKPSSVSGGARDKVRVRIQHSSAPPHHSSLKSAASSHGIQGGGDAPDIFMRLLNPYSSTPYIHATYI